MAERLKRTALRAAEDGKLPDWMVRVGVRMLAAGRLRELDRAPDLPRSTFTHGPIAVETQAANRQHYEVPPEFFQLVLGPCMKYSCGLWKNGTRDLAVAEREMLDLSLARSGVAGNDRVLDLGCGWGSFALFCASHRPDARVTAVSNSASQGAWLGRRATEAGADGVRVLTADINDLQFPEASFDRVVSIEMFEHLRNYEAVFDRLDRWLAPGGTVFIHVFAHRRRTYLFRAEGAGDWMAREFFTGGVMPGRGLLPDLARGFVLEDSWWHSGRHYQQTAEAWLARLDANRAGARQILASARDGSAARDLHRWRMFFLAVAETFGVDQGREWGVAHYRFRKTDRREGPGA